MNLHSLVLLPLLLCPSLNAADSSSADSSPSHQEHSVQIPQENSPTAKEMHQYFIDRAKKNKKIVVALITSLLIAGAATDCALVALAPTTGNTAVTWNATRLSRCSYADAPDCSFVTNKESCEYICTTNKKNFATHFDASTNPLSPQDVENCYLLQNCPTDAQSYLLLAALSLASRVLTALLPLWLDCID